MDAEAFSLTEMSQEVLGGLLNLLSLSQNRTMLKAPRNKWQDLISRNFFSCCFLCCSHPGESCSRLACQTACSYLPDFADQRGLNQAITKSGLAIYNCGHWSLWESPALVLELVHRTGGQRKPLPGQSFLVPHKQNFTWFLRKEVNSSEVFSKS